MKSKEKWKVLKNVFSEFSIRNLFKLSSQGYFEDLESPISIGKEANIFSAVTKNGERIIAKIYRLENCNFNQMHSYIISDPRYLDLKDRKRLIVFAWVQREYRNLMKAREVIKVPTPIAVKDNILLMEFIGKQDPAQMLKKQIPKNIGAFFDETIENIRKLYKQGLVHGDLSEFNILNFEEKPVFIDFSQATITENPMAKELLERDIQNVCNFFKKHIEIDEEKVKKKILSQE